MTTDGDIVPGQSANSRPLQEAPPLPRGDRLVELALLGAREVHADARRRRRRRRSRNSADASNSAIASASVAGTRGSSSRGVHVAAKHRRRFDVFRHPVEPGGERRGEREVRIGIGTGDAALDAQRRTTADDAKARGAVVDAQAMRWARTCRRGSACTSSRWARTGACRRVQ